MENKNINCFIFDSISSELLKLVGNFDKDNIVQSWPVESWRRELEKAGSFISVAYHDTVVVGLALFSIDSFEENADLYKICVSKEFRRFKVGSVILGRVYLFLKNIGVGHIYLDVDSENRAAIAFYRSNNFKELRCRRGYYTNGGDSLLMRATL